VSKKKAEGPNSFSIACHLSDLALSVTVDGRVIIAVSGGWHNLAFLTREL
jgi:hypothetical protein